MIKWLKLPFDSAGMQRLKAAAKRRKKTVVQWAVPVLLHRAWYDDALSDPDTPMGARCREGGIKKAAAMSPEERRDLARKAATARWHPEQPNGEFEKYAED